jgi:reductive dehalogenase
MNILNKSSRPMHLGPFPLEKIKWVEQPTTLIIDDEVRRIPKRADGFHRATIGDFGERQRAARLKSGGARESGNMRPAPLNGAIRSTLLKLSKDHDGDVAPDLAPITDDLELRSQNLKALCYFLGADQAGICEAKPYVWYSHQKDGTPIDIYHKNAIVVLLDQSYPTQDASCGDDYASGPMRSYMRGAEICNIVAGYIRGMGYSARAHSSVDSDVMQPPLVLLAGLGEMSRIGETVLNPFIGPRFKCAVVTTDMDLAPDKPIDFGLQDYCEKCQKCARECPVGAIPYGPKIMYNGYETWKQDVAKCTSYRTCNPNGAGCGRCLKVCPWNKADHVSHRLARWSAINLPWSRRALIRLDDMLGFGNRNPVKKWWFDLTVEDGKVIMAKNPNQRDINPKKKKPKNHRVALYTPDMLPPSDEMDVFPYDRKAGYEVAAKMETPEEARRRTGA